MSLSDYGATRAARTDPELLALVEAIYNSPKGTQEKNWLEWKSTLDLETPEGRFAVAKTILGLANRAVDQAQLACEGVSYLVVGVEPGSAAGVASFDHAKLGQKIRAYADTPRWTPQYVEFSGETVLVIVVEPPRAGDPIHTLKKEFTKGGTGHQMGKIFHRYEAHTDQAGPAEVVMLSQRLLAGESDESRQAERVGFMASPVMFGQTGWMIQNDSDAPIYGAVVRAATDSSQIIVYHGSGPEWSDQYEEPVVAAHQSSQRMFRPGESGPRAANGPEIDRMALTFADARNIRWERIGSQPPRKVG